MLAFQCLASSETRLLQAKGALTVKETPVGCDASGVGASVKAQRDTYRLQLFIVCRCVFVRDGDVVGRGHNLTNATRNVGSRSRCVKPKCFHHAVMNSVTCRIVHRILLCRERGTLSWWLLTRLLQTVMGTQHVAGPSTSRCSKA